MEGGVYASLIPVHTLGLGDEASTSMLFGFDYQDMVPDTVGLMPVLVEEPKGSSYRPKEVLNRWRQCFQWMFLSSQPDRLLDFSGGTIKNIDAHNNIKAALQSSESTYTARHKMGLTPFDSVFEQFLVDLRVLPRKVVKSPCQGCAQDGGWTLTLSWALWHPDKTVLFPRWNPLMPSQPESAAANATHGGDVYDFCNDVWLEVREVFKDVIENAMKIEYHQAAGQDEDGSLMQEVEEEANRRWCESVASSHRTLWYPPDWLLPEFWERFNAEAPAVTERNPLTSRFLRDCGLEDPYDIWGEGMRHEIEGRRQVAA